MAAFARICLIGAESTGKSELAAALAQHFGRQVVPEFAREYALSMARPLSADDVEPIARGAIALLDAAPELAICDTDLMSTVVYSRYYYGSCPEWIEAEARRRLADIYLLMEADVPWSPDPARDAAADRAELHRQFRTALEQFGANFVEISGDWNERKRKALATLSS